MALLTVLFFLMLQRFANVGNWFQVSWFEIYLRRLNPWLIKLNEWLAIIAIIVPVLLLLAFLHAVLTKSFFGLLDLFFTILILLLCLDARDLKSQLTTYFNAIEKNDSQLATTTVTNFIDNGANTNTVGDLCRAVTTTILSKAFTQLFAGLFWFMVFGTYGITTYFLITLLCQNALKVDANYAGIAKLATHIHDVLDWVPSRLAGISYALVGNFNQGFDYCSNHLWLSLNEANKYAVASGLAALGVDPDQAKATVRENHEALNIVSRVLVLWLVALALVLLGIWL